MNKLILCEGVTDAILLSYYLGKTAGWEFCSKGPKELAIKTYNQNESVNWYKKGDDYLLICGVGGKDNFGNFFETRIKRPIVDANAFEKVAVVTDRDERGIAEIESGLLDSLQSLFQTVKNRAWSKNEYTDSFGMRNEIEMLLLVVPKEHLGALENVMLAAISEDPYDKRIVEKAADFVREMRQDAGKYISSDRLQLKAHLGVTWAIQYPEKVFSLIHEQICSVEWEKSEVLQKCFGLLCEI